MQRITTQDWIKTILYLTLFIIIIILGAIFLLPKLWYLWAIIILAGILWITKWHTDNFAYKCKSCKHEFTISMWLDLINPHGISKKGAWQLLKCPKCHKWSKAGIIKRK